MERMERMEANGVKNRKSIFCGALRAPYFPNSMTHFFYTCSPAAPQWPRGANCEVVDGAYSLPTRQGQLRTTLRKRGEAKFFIGDWLLICRIIRYYALCLALICEKKRKGIGTRTHKEPTRRADWLAFCSTSIMKEPGGLSYSQSIPGRKLLILGAQAFAFLSFGQTRTLSLSHSIRLHSPSIRLHSPPRGSPTHSLKWFL